MKPFTIITNRERRYGENSSSETTYNSIEEAVKAFSYTLDKGRSWEYEKGNKKINCNPKTKISLIKNINQSERNAAADGWPSTQYSLKQ